MRGIRRRVHAAEQAAEQAARDLAAIRAQRPLVLTLSRQVEHHRELNGFNQMIVTVFSGRG